MDNEKIDKIKIEGINFKRGKDESQPATPFKPKFTKPRGKTISGASKMKAAYKARRAAKSKRG